MITGTTPAVPVSTPATSSSATSGSATLGEDAFLKLLVQQLQNQDPLNPMQGTEFASQLAQFSSVEQLSNINTQLKQSLDANSMLTASINNALATNFIGKGVRALTNTANYDGTTKIKVGFTLNQSVYQTNVSVLDASGKVVRHINNVTTSPGDSAVTWDGLDDNGKAVPAGQVTFKVETLDRDNNPVQAVGQQYLYGTVSGVRFKSTGTVFVIDGQEIPLSEVLEIMQQG